MTALSDIFLYLYLFALVRTLEEMKSSGGRRYFKK